MSNTFDQIDGKDIRWASKDGVMHAVEGSDVHRGIRLLWPKCGKGDVPAGKAWLGVDQVTCPDCQQALAIREAEDAA